MIKKTLPEIDKIQETLQEFFKKREEILFSFLFGSIPNNKTTGVSDIDIAVMVDYNRIDGSNYRYGYKAELISELISLLSFNDIDLIILNDAPILLKHRIARFGKLIYSKDDRMSLEFQVKALEQYLDFHPLNILQRD